MRTIGSVFFLTIFVIAGTAFAQTLTIYTEEFPPYNFTEGNKFVGASTEVVEAVVKKAGLDYEIISYPWARTYELAAASPNSIIFSISRRPKRETTFRWIGLITPSRHSVFALKSRTDIKIEKIDDLKKYAIGTTIGDARETYLLENGFIASDLQRVAGKAANLQNYQKLKLGRIDLWTMSEAVANYTVKKSGDDPDKKIRKVFEFEEMSKQGNYMASSLQTSDDVVRTIKETLDEFKKTAEYEQILEKWDMTNMLELNK